MDVLPGFFLFSAFEFCNHFVLFGRRDYLGSHGEQNTVILGNVRAKQGNLLESVIDHLLACTCLTGREPVCSSAHIPSKASTLFVFGRHDTDGTTFGRGARGLHCGEENAFFLLVMASVGETLDEVSGRGEDGRVDLVPGSQAAGGHS
jgi:hypothetical protein